MSDDAVVIRRQGRAGRITLNRPGSLNALDTDMIRTITGTLTAWRDDPAVELVILDAAGDRAFCAGGDVRSLRNWVLADEFDRAEAFFADEYALNLAIAQYPKLYVALIDGLWMGGGVGLAVHGAVRVVSERAQFGMPEAQIGLFPDVGMSFVLPLLPHGFGLYLGLTGRRVGAGDACWLGLATHFLPTAEMSGIADALAADGIGALPTSPPSPPTFPAIADGVNEIFARSSVDEIVAALAGSDEAWTQAALEAIRTASPTSLAWTFELIRAGATRTLEECLLAELQMTRRAMRWPDFAEGVRALVIDKDRAPKWADSGASIR